MTSTTTPASRGRFRRKFFTSLNRDQSDGSSASQSSSIPSTHVTSHKRGNRPSSTTMDHTTPAAPTDRNIFKGAEILRNQLLSKHKKEKQQQQQSQSQIDGTLGSSNHSYSAKDVQAVQADLMMSTKRRSNGTSTSTPKTISDDDTSLWSEDDPWAKDPWRNKRQQQQQQQQQQQGSGGHYGMARSSPQEILDAWAEDIHHRRRPPPKAATPPRKKEPTGELIMSKSKDLGTSAAVVSPMTQDALEESNYLHEKYSHHNKKIQGVSFGSGGLWDDQDSSVGDNSSMSSYSLNPLSRDRPRSLSSRNVSEASSVGSSSVVTPPSQRVDESYDWPPPPTGSLKSQRESDAEFDAYYDDDNDDYTDGDYTDDDTSNHRSEALAQADSADTPETRMGRNRSLRLKIETFLVEPDCGLENHTTDDDESGEPAPAASGFYNNTTNDQEQERPHPIVDDYQNQKDKDEYHHFDEDDDDIDDGFHAGKVGNAITRKMLDDEDDIDDLGGYNYGDTQEDDYIVQHEGIERKLTEDDHKAAYVPQKYQEPSNFSLTPEKKAPPPPQPAVTSPKILKTSSALQHYGRLLKDPAYIHAQQAGILWQNIVGQHVRFPSKWWNGARSPPMGVEEAFQQGWKYVARHNVKKNPTFMKMVKNRSAPGRLLLHVVVRDLMTWKPVQDIVIGCFHPNARGIRKGSTPDPTQEKCRDIWLAIRKRSREGSVSLIDPLLTKGKSLKKANDSPLGNRKAVTNVNMRAVFGDKPPISTVYILESELYDKMREAEENSSVSKSPALILLEEFLFQNRDECY